MPQYQCKQQNHTYSQQWNGHFPQKGRGFVSIFIQNSQLYHIMNVLNWAVNRRTPTRYSHPTHNTDKTCYFHISFLQCEGFAPLWIETFVDRVSPKFAVTQLDHTQGVAFSCKWQKCYNLIIKSKSGDHGKEQWLWWNTIEVCCWKVICPYNLDLKEANLPHTLVRVF